LWFPLLIWWTPLCLIRQILTRRFRLYAYDLASMEPISLVKSWLREAGAHNVLVISAVNNNGVTELFALLHTEEGCC
ncbi:hypothetical protein ODS01_21960, partial [Escherichia coli]|nr:hypothetical protein [Escherichia coli]MCV8319839.1 hypothetical protein [Escherichia coli]MCV8436015.1 hypothetical protein [Escherichia coli]